MNHIKIVDNKNSNILHEFKSTFVPEVDEFIWYGKDKNNYWQVTGRVIEFDEGNYFTKVGKLIITLLVKV